MCDKLRQSTDMYSRLCSTRQCYSHFQISTYTSAQHIRTQHKKCHDRSRTRPCRQAMAFCTCHLSSCACPTTRSCTRFMMTESTLYPLAETDWKTALLSYHTRSDEELRDEGWRWAGIDVCGWWMESVGVRHTLLPLLRCRRADFRVDAKTTVDQTKVERLMMSALIVERNLRCIVP